MPSQHDPICSFHFPFSYLNDNISKYGEIKNIENPVKIAAVSEDRSLLSSEPPDEDSQKSVEE
jgi:hypothetical protein